MVTRELEPNRKLFPDHISSILDGALVGADSLWPATATAPASLAPNLT
jgi:hypothetical protein